MRNCKDIANLLFWELLECLAIPIKIMVPICSMLSYLSACKKSSSSLTSFLLVIYLLYFFSFLLQTCYLGSLDMSGHTHTLKMIVPICRNLWSLSVGKRSISSFKFSLRYYKDVVNLLFWVLWVCLATHTQNDTLDL